MACHYYYYFIIILLCKISTQTRDNTVLSHPPRSPHQQARSPPHRKHRTSQFAHLTRHKHACTLNHYPILYYTHCSVLTRMPSAQPILVHSSRPSALISSFISPRSPTPCSPAATHLHAARGHRLYRARSNPTALKHPYPVPGPASLACANFCPSFPFSPLVFTGRLLQLLPPHSPRPLRCGSAF